MQMMDMKNKMYTMEHDDNYETDEPVTKNMSLINIKIMMTIMNLLKMITIKMMTMMKRLRIQKMMRLLT